MGSVRETKVKRPVMQRGRPKGDINRNKHINVNASEKCIDELKALTELTGETKTEAIEKAIRVRYNLLKYGGDSEVN